jgi:hypothetical protein
VAGREGDENTKIGRRRFIMSRKRAKKEEIREI